MKNKYDEYCQQFYPFDVAYTDINDEYAYPSKLKELLAEFDIDGRHYIIYTKKDEND